MRLLQEQGARMARERRLLEEHARLTPSFTLQGWNASPAGELCVNFELKLVKSSFAGVLVYPELFPDVPAFVRPQKAGESWSSHQYRGTGVLCLQYGPDNWHRDVTGVDLIESANTLIWGEILHGVLPDVGPVPSRHVVPDAHAPGANSERLVMTQALKDLIADPGRAGPVQLQGVVDWLKGESVAVVLQAGDPLVTLADVPGTLAQGPGVQFSGVAVPVPVAAHVADAKDAQDLQVRLGAAWPWEEGLADKLLVLLAHEAAGQLCAFLLKGGSKPLFQRYHPADFGADEPQRLPSNFSKLPGDSVAIVGMGSLGSKIAISLARAGVRNFVLVDDDVLGRSQRVQLARRWLLQARGRGSCAEACCAWSFGDCVAGQDCGTGQPICRSDGCEGGGFLHDGHRRDGEPERVRRARRNHQASRAGACMGRGVWRWGRGAHGAQPSRHRR